MSKNPLTRKERLTMPRTDPQKRDAHERVGDFKEIYRMYDPPDAIKEASRCVECKNPACEIACPAHNHIRDWLVLTAEGRFQEAAELSHQTSSLPEVCGRICPQDRLCEKKCIVGIKNDPVAIGAIEAFINEWAFDQGWRPVVDTVSASGYQVAVVGAGPAGLACADALQKLGHAVTVFEAYAEAGGLLLWGIPSFKLEKRVVERRVNWLKERGVQFTCNTRVGEDVTLDALFARGFKAVFLGNGAMQPKKSRMPGENLNGVLEAIPFLIRQNVDEALIGSDAAPRWDFSGKRVVVLGGGDTAMDCVRSSARSGATKVSCVYRRDEKNMPGSRREIRSAKEEGVDFQFLTQPLEFVGDGDQLRAISCQKMELGEPDEAGRQRPVPVPDSVFEVACDIAIVAFGFDPAPVPNPQPDKIKTNDWGGMVVDEGGMTSWPGVFAGGDTVRGADLVVTAMKDGLEAAKSIDQYLSA